MSAPRGDERFHALLQQIGDLHDRKQADYGAGSDPFANVRATEKWGMPGWVGSMMRANDKVHRLQQFAQKGVLANESVEDSLMDIAVYALIALILYREESESVEGTTTSTTPSVKGVDTQPEKDTCPVGEAGQHRWLRKDSETLHCIHCRATKYSDAFG